MTKEKAIQLFDKWVHILHLEGWHISFEWKVPGHCMNVEESVGATKYQHSTGQAIVQMVDPEDYPKDTPFPYDYEKTLVHELLHLKFADLDDTGDNLRDKLTHRLVDDLAVAFIEASKEA